MAKGSNGIEDLNLSTPHNLLGLMRHLCQSDLAFTYMLLTDDSRRDIVKMCMEMYDLCENFGDMSLTKEEEAEYMDLIKSIDPDYVG